MTESLHEKIYNELLHKIKTHFYEEGAQLPTEAELALQYNSSKAPVRQALDYLQQEGFILRRPGKGTFIAGRREWPHLNLGGFEQDFEENNQYLYCKTLSVQDLPLPKDIAKAVGIPAGTPAVSVQRIRYFKDKPLYYLHHFIFGMESALIKKEGNFSSLLAIYDQYHIPIVRTEDELQAVPVPQKIAELLRVPPHTAVMLINRKTYREKGRLLEFVCFYVLTEEWKYRVQYQEK